jgi:hypothetical protein
LITPGFAHVTPVFGHLWQQHIKPKTDNRYDQVAVVTSVDSVTTTNAVTYEDLPGGLATIQVPGGGGNWYVVARFDAESICLGLDGSWCSVQILIGGTPGGPDDGDNYAFDSPGDSPGEDWEGHALTRSRLVGPGTYEVKVQWALVDATSFRLDDWSLTVETLRA